MTGVAVAAADGTVVAAQGRNPVWASRYCHMVSRADKLTARMVLNDYLACAAAW